jgi:hypothetical protein
MNLTSLQYFLESEMLKRQAELRHLQNLSGQLRSERRKNQLRRALVTILYAHFEGFCKSAFVAYATGINSERVSCEQVLPEIAALSHGEVFAGLRDPSSKDSFFRNLLPDDAKLHRFARDREFVARMSDFYSLPVEIPKRAVDVEDNLKPSVLLKIVYQLGLPLNRYRRYTGQIDKLLNYRNQVAHGELDVKISERRYTSLRDSVFKMMADISRDIMSAASIRAYLKPPAA